MGAFLWRLNDMSDVQHINWKIIRESDLVKQALTHPSRAQTAGENPYNNQRLEFLGDSVLGLVIADMLYHMYPNEQEGDLARRLSALVCGERLVEVAHSIGLGETLILSESEEENNGRENPSNLEDACEALIGALYLDGGFDAAKQFIHQHWHDLAKSVNEPPKDPKTELQEWAQQRKLPLPEYEEINREGPAHAPEFTIKVSVANHGDAQATANSKKQAEREAAQALLAKIS